jgi:light-regulated signal transduction histidine kinase (bacteriophytochrome)/HAMP domain-containing protein
LLVAASAMLGAWFFARKHFLRPLHQIVGAAQRLATGDFSARTGLHDGKSELHQLAHHFDDMAENLQRHEAQLREANEKISKLNADLEKRVIERTAQLEASNRELEAFSYSVSHDLRAPLRHLDGFAQILATEPNIQNDERAQRYLKMITQSAKKMGMLIDDLLSFSRMGRKTMVCQNVDFNALLREVIAEFREEAQGREIEWSLADLPVVSGDAAMLRQVWANLISNALKYTRGRAPAKIEVGYREESGEQIFFVRDNGAGFEMKYAEKLFGVFQRLHSEESFEGTGIGLANVRRIISRHSGRTWAEGQLDKGAIFYFSLPKPASSGAMSPPPVKAV